MKDWGIPLIHEAAHWKHIDDTVTQNTWSKLFNKSDGYITPYASHDYIESGNLWKANSPDSEPISRKVQGVDVELYDFHRLDAGANDQFWKLTREFSEIPDKLFVFDYIRIEPSLNGPAYFSYKEAREEFQRTAEDVAVTTEWAYVCHTLGAYAGKPFFKLDENPIIQDKIDYLAQRGYIEDHVANTLLNKSWRESRLNSLKRQEPTSGVLVTLPDAYTDMVCMKRQMLDRFQSN